MKLHIFLAGQWLLIFLSFSDSAKNHRNVPDGGRPANPGEAPYHLTLYYNKVAFCGGALVEVDGFQIGLTAAHCVSTNQFIHSISYDVYAGDINMKEKSGMEQKRFVERVFIHPNYTDADINNDIAILLLNSPFKFSENVQIATLPMQGQVTNEGNLTLSGWGNLVFGDPSANRDLKISKIPIVSKKNCQRAYQNFSVRDIDNVICGGWATRDTMASCNIDSGGPAVSEQGYLAGIVAFGQECVNVQYPVVFTKTSDFVDWIKETVKTIEPSMLTN